MTPLRWWLVTVTALAMLLALSWCVQAAPVCMATGKLVLATGAKHATWNWIVGRKCWRAGYPAAARIGKVSALRTPVPGRATERRSSAPPPWHTYTQSDVDAAWREYDAARQRYDAAAMFLNLLMFGTLCPQNDGECNFGRRMGR